MKKIVRPLVVLAALGGLLFVSNPSRDDFAAHLAREAKAGTKTEGAIGDFLKDVGGSVGKLSASAFKRQDRFLFSVYSGLGRSYVGFAKVVFVRVK